jgi:DNA polymerase-3 subunit delta
VRTLLRIKRGVAAGKPLAMLVRENRVWGPRERLIGPALSRVTEAALEKALVLAAKLDRQVKGLSGSTPGRRQSDPPPDPWAGLFELAMIVAAAAPASAARPAAPAAGGMPRMPAAGGRPSTAASSRRPS